MPETLEAQIDSLGRMDGHRTVRQVVQDGPRRRQKPRKTKQPVPASWWADPER